MPLRGESSSYDNNIFFQYITITGIAETCDTTNIECCPYGSTKNKNFQLIELQINHLAQILLGKIWVLWASGQVVRALDCCGKHRWFEPNPRIIVGMLAHCSPSSKWVPGGNTGEVKGGEERNWPPYLTMTAAQGKCPSNGHSPNVRNRTWDSPLPFFTMDKYVFG